MFQFWMSLGWLIAFDLGHLFSLSGSCSESWLMSENSLWMFPSQPVMVWLRPLRGLKRGGERSPSAFFLSFLLMLTIRWLTSSSLCNTGVASWSLSPLLLHARECKCGKKSAQADADKTACWPPRLRFIRNPIALRPHMSYETLRDSCHSVWFVHFFPILQVNYNLCIFSCQYHHTVEGIKFCCICLCPTRSCHGSASSYSQTSSIQWRVPIQTTTMNPNHHLNRFKSWFPITLWRRRHSNADGRSLTVQENSPSRWISPDTSRCTLTLAKSDSYKCQEKCVLLLFATEFASSSFPPGTH